MNQLATAALTMSSSDIADLVESRHDHVKRSIERLAERGVIKLPPMGEVKNHLNQSVAVYLIGKRDSYVVVAQLSPEFTARLVDRWQELEQAQQQAIPQSFSEALRLAADLAEQKQKLATELAAAAPKVEFVDRYCSASGSMSFRQVAKLLKAKENEFRLFLIDRGILYRLGGTLTPMAAHIDAGRFEVKTGTSVTSNHAFSQARFTAKGVRWIGGLWAEHIAKGQAA
ncbi:phage antirepressor YoqD-like protein [Citrobacter amalonaticus]|uniref:phage antirepressor KilAC domain-containing protein n=1 Tax=Enterobacteriaceae TaxID=543 RepID=UPI00130229A7|nr:MULTISPECIES: DNA-binding protein [Enterobacteriaceae]HCD1999046.1 phage antirepressor KilAC domain-containing protein [Citrobacter farmeri]KAE9687814.1 phage regulatory protein/antirepressor Ant [Escherichia coli]MCP1629643.1 phage antirepressor YoqD-like protein [Citrobacter amalonaticus]MDT7071031.1 phage antirepressor KilAC domain-containing protein [Citrobacter amalonaticus]HAU4370756.1 phage regulatory protein/antirepressor Ant [Citrobacter amalonaticus]